MGHEAFFALVREYIEKHPEAAAHISDHVASGLIESRRQILERACDFETALAVAIAKRWPSRENVIISKLEKWDGKSALPWADTIAEIRRASTPKTRAEP